MEALSIIGGIVGVALIGIVCFQIHQYSKSRYDYSPFNVIEAGLFLGSAICCVITLYLLPNGIQEVVDLITSIVRFELEEYQLNPAVTLIMGLILFIGGYWRITIKSNFLISVVSGTVMYVVSFIVIVLLILYLADRQSKKGAQK